MWHANQNVGDATTKHGNRKQDVQSGQFTQSASNAFGRTEIRWSQPCPCPGRATPPSPNPQTQELSEGHPLGLHTHLYSEQGTALAQTRPLCPGSHTDSGAEVSHGLTGGKGVDARRGQGQCFPGFLWAPLGLGLASPG